MQQLIMISPLINTCLLFLFLCAIPFVVRWFSRHHSRLEAKITYLEQQLEASSKKLERPSDVH